MRQAAGMQADFWSSLAVFCQALQRHIYSIISLACASPLGYWHYCLVAPEYDRTSGAYSTPHPFCMQPDSMQALAAQKEGSMP